jgi:transposase-like protein
MKSPPFCPNPQCCNHDKAPQSRWYWKSGHYRSRFSGSVQRFQCFSCSHRFSSQTFSIDYYAKRKVNYHAIDRQLRSTGSIRDISRDLRVSTDTVLNRISRLARNALAAHQTLCATAPQSEDLVADGFESFCFSQYFPNNITLLAGKDSQYLYFANYCTLRRKGRMTDTQKKTREILEQRWKADPKALRRAFDELVDQINCDGPIRHLYTDEKREYSESVKANKNRDVIDHIRISSKLPRTVSNDLFSVNYLDREIRKDSANHVRETLCFSRDVNNSMERLWVYFVYHNYRKPYRIHPTESRTHAEVAGIEVSRIQKALKGYFTRRSFLSRTDLRGSQRDLWLRRLENPMAGSQVQMPKHLAA